MKGTCVMKSNAKYFENESQRRNEKGNPIPAGKNQTLTKIERDMRKQGGGGALKRAAAPLFWHGRLYLCQRLIFSCGNGVSFLIPSLRFIFKAFCIRFHYTCSLHVPSMFLNPVGFLVNPIVKDKWRSAIYIYIYIYKCICTYIYI